MQCTSCGEQNAPGRKFCLRCGSPLSLTCGNCGAANEGHAQFCGECGRSLTPAPPAEPAPAATAERRLVSVVFVDLVGFTAASEQRDPEQVRELLTRYFEAGRRLVALYGGSLEKFIGDALMAVWGAPVANEDDAERAVRAALDLLEAVEQLGEEAGLPELRARAAVLTGEAAVTVGAVGQGIVAGDLVNTASRVQALAEPGSVLVSDATRRVTEAAIAYEDAGLHTVRGKTEPVHLWRAQRVIGARAGSQRGAGLEPPFTGRDRELRLLKELFLASSEERKAHLVSVTGIAGIGKSRLGWELVKYLDGVAMVVRYATGRCLAYGEGITYWALAEMVRRRAGIAEGDPAEAAAAKLRACLQEHLPDDEERRWIEPRLGVLLGLGDAPASDRQDLFAAWRRFFESLAEAAPTVLLFEDMQWADPALLEFIDYLLDWSRGHPLFVVSLGRPSPAERGLAGGRNQTQLHLEPLPEQAMRKLVGELVPGLPAAALQRIVERSEGVPLYAVETIRMLLDRGVLVADGSLYKLASELTSLEVPESLHGLISARLDGLSAEERRLVQCGSVLGKTFTAQAVAHLLGRPDNDVQPLLVALVRKDVLAVQADPRSPERGQYGFVQDLVREVAYDMLSRHDRRQLHLLVASFLEQNAQSEAEVAEVVAAHYADAYAAVPDAADAGETRTKARAAMERAGDRAASLGAPEQAETYYEKALDLAEDRVLQAELHRKAGDMALAGRRTAKARSHYESAAATYEALQRYDELALVAASMGQVGFVESKFSDAIERLEHVLALLDHEQPGRGLATASAQLGRLFMFSRRIDEGLVRVEVALQLAEELDLGEVFVDGLNSRAVGLMTKGRFREAEALLWKALEVADAIEYRVGQMRSLSNLGVVLGPFDRLREALAVSDRAIELARRTGDRTMMLGQIGGSIDLLFVAGDWDRSLERYQAARELLSEHGSAMWGEPEMLAASQVFINRGQVSEAEELIAGQERLRSSENGQLRGMFLYFSALVHHAAGRHEEALRDLDQGMTFVADLNRQFLKYNLELAMDSALALGDVPKARRYLATLEAMKPGELSPYARAARDRYRARIAVAEGGGEHAGQGFAAAAALYRETELPFHQAVVQLEHAEWLAGAGRADDARELLAEAGAIFGRLKAGPWVERVERARAAAPVASGPG